jgi:quercetin dioxygenase-like cupin family protein
MPTYGIHLLDELKPYTHPLAPNPEAPFVVRADEGERWRLAGDTYTIKVPGERTNNRFCLVHFDIPPGGGPKPHVHTRDEEIFHILEGEPSFYADGDVVQGKAGQTVVLPRNIPHCFANRTSERCAFLTIT